MKDKANGNEMCVIEGKYHGTTNLVLVCYVWIECHYNVSETLELQLQMQANEN